MRAACSTGKYRSPYGSELLSWSASSAGCWSHLTQCFSHSVSHFRWSPISHTGHSNVPCPISRCASSSSLIARIRSAFVIVFGTYAPHGHVEPEPVRQSSYLVQFSHFIITHALSVLRGRQCNLYQKSRHIHFSLEILFLPHLQSSRVARYGLL